MNLENSLKEMVQVYLVTLQLKLEFLLKFGDIIYLLIDLKSQILNFHGVISFKKITVNFLKMLAIYVKEPLNSVTNKIGRAHV